jgi:hypothetical protein
MHHIMVVISQGLTYNDLAHWANKQFISTVALLNIVPLGSEIVGKTPKIAL